MEDQNFEFEAKLIRQEHRFVFVWINFFKYFLNRDIVSNDPRKDASLHAWVWGNFGPGAISVVGIGALSVFTLYLSWQSNELIKQQNDLVKQEKVASYLPVLYIKPVDFRLSIPKDGSEDFVEYKGEGKEGHSFLATAYLPMELVNLGKGSAKSVDIKYYFDRDKIVNILKETGKIQIVENNGKIDQVKFADNSLQFFDSSRLPPVHYVLPLDQQKEISEIYLPNEYSGLYAAYAWAVSNRILNVNLNEGFPNLTVSMKYFDIENQEHSMEYQVEIFENMNVWFPKHEKWLQLVKFRPTIKS